MAVACSARHGEEFEFDGKQKVQCSMASESLRRCNDISEATYVSILVRISLVL